jgi:CxxC motif-containing protein (DUF1111 family)
MARRTAVVLLVAVLAACGSDGDSASVVVDAQLGGETTREVDNQNAFSFPAPKLSNEQRRLFEVGDSFFTENWVTAPASTDARDGLGPMFNAQSCSSCHLLDGRGIPASTGNGELGLLVRLSVPGTGAQGEPLDEPNYGGQLQDRANLGIPAEGELVIDYEDQPGTFGDGTPYSLRVPTYSIEGEAFGPLVDDVLISPRLAPQVVGMGLLEAVPESDIVAAADPDDGDGDGISGRPNRAWNPRTRQTELGRFGWKANVPSVEAQVAGAFHGDIGITSDLHPDQGCTAVETACQQAVDGGEPEITGERLAAVTFYSRTLAVPAMRDTDSDDVRDGAEVFEQLGCASCHSPTLHTGDSPSVDIATLADQVIHPYTDLLLHDMGRGLADNRPDFEATGSEWRTPPLWGLGLIDEVNGERFLLHDGRARSIEEAILWHGGEGEAAEESFRSAPAETRRKLLAFLEAL